MPVSACLRETLQWCPTASLFWSLPPGTPICWVQPRSHPLHDHWDLGLDPVLERAFCAPAREAPFPIKASQFHKFFRVKIYCLHVVIRWAPYLCRRCSCNLGHLWPSRPRSLKWSSLFSFSWLSSLSTVTKRIGMQKSCAVEQKTGYDNSSSRWIFPLSPCKKQIMISRRFLKLKKSKILIFRKVNAKPKAFRLCVSTCSKHRHVKMVGDVSQDFFLVLITNLRPGL